MKFFVTSLLLALAIIATVHAQIQVRPRHPRSVFPPRDRPFGVPRPWPGKPVPTFPRPPIYRIRRSANNDEGIKWNVDLDRGKPSWNVQAQKKLYENKHGSIHMSGGIDSHRGGRPQGNIGIGGRFSWRG